MRDPNLKDVLWYRPDGKEMAGEDWSNPFTKCLGMLLAGDAIDERDERGNTIIDDTMLLLLNAHYEPIFFTMPSFQFEGQWELFEGQWELIMDTRSPSGRRRIRKLWPGETYELEGRSIALFSFRGGEREEE